MRYLLMVLIDYFCEFRDFRKRTFAKKGVALNTPVWFILIKIGRRANIIKLIRKNIYLNLL